MQPEIRRKIKKINKRSISSENKFESNISIRSLTFLVQFNSSGKFGLICIEDFRKNRVLWSDKKVRSHLFVGKNLSESIVVVRNQIENEANAIESNVLCQHSVRSISFIHSRRNRLESRLIQRKIPVGLAIPFTVAAHIGKNACGSRAADLNEP